MCRARSQTNAEDRSRDSGFLHSTNGSSSSKLAARNDFVEDEIREAGDPAREDLNGADLQGGNLNTVSKSSVDSAGKAASELIEATANANESREAAGVSSRAQNGRELESESQTEEISEDQIIIDDWCAFLS